MEKLDLNKVRRHKLEDDNKNKSKNGRCMQSSIGQFNKRIDEQLAKEIRNNGRYLGCSRCVKDCYWDCFTYNNKFYIFLNDEYDAWECTLEEVEQYNECPV